MATYSRSDKFIHRLYLSNYSISRATLEMDEIINGAKARAWEVNQHVFVTGLARSGTTAVMRKIFASGDYASLQYSNMPFLLCPNLWNRKASLEAEERAHNDGIIIDGSSPEEFDEYFWKVFLNDSYIGEDGMRVHQVKEDVLDKYKNYIRLVCLSKGHHRYLSKNNNNILRLNSINSLDNSFVVMLFREPLSHAASLKKLHEKFSESQKEDPFSLEYFNYLGHHEFGLNHKPFLLTNEFNNIDSYKPDSINYWLVIWLNYYKYVFEHLDQINILIRFEDLIEKGVLIYNKLWKLLQINSLMVAEKRHKPNSYSIKEFDQDLLDQCNKLYNQLSTAKIL